MWIHWLGFFLLLAGFVLCGVLQRPLSFDEQNYYLPAIQFFSAQLPGMPLSDYPFPAPPLGLYVYSMVYALFGEVAVYVRGASLAVFVGSSLFAARILQREHGGTAAGAFFIALMCLPPVMQHGFTLRIHMMVFFLLLAATMYAPHPKRQQSRAHSAALGGVLSCAVLMHQFALAYVGTLMLLEIVRLCRPHQQEASGFTLLALALPLCLMTALVLLWGGATPPSYSEVAFGEYNPGGGGVFAIRFKQLLTLLLTFGVFIAPLLLQHRREVFYVLVVALPVTVTLHYFTAFHVSSSFVSPEQFHGAIVGPITGTLRLLSADRYPLFLPLFSTVVSLGGVMLVAAAIRSANGRFVLLYAVVYAAMMSAVPSYFEHYFAMFLIVSLWELRQEIIRAAQQARLKLVYLYLVGFSGAAYTAITIFFRR